MEGFLEAVQAVEALGHQSPLFRSAGVVVIGSIQLFQQFHSVILDVPGLAAGRNLRR